MKNPLKRATRNRIRRLEDCLLVAEKILTESGDVKKALERIGHTSRAVRRGRQADLLLAERKTAAIAAQPKKETGQ